MELTYLQEMTIRQAQSNIWKTYFIKVVVLILSIFHVIFQFQSPQTCNIEPHTIEIMSCDNDDCTVVSTDVTHSISDDGSFMVTANLSLNAKERYSICANVTYETGEYLITNKVEVSKYTKHVHVHVHVLIDIL